MRKMFAIGTLLLSSAAVMVSPAAASDRNANVNNQNYSRGYSAPAPSVMVSPSASNRNTYVNNQNYSRGYSAPAPVVSSYGQRGGFDREAQIRIDQRVRAERLERERHERARHDVRYLRSLRDGC
jgi:hypothetical protein